jgi:hypothetical protein
MDDDAPKPDDLVSRVSHLEGVVETEDKSVERGLENVKHTQALLIGLCAIMIGAAVAFFVYILNRLDTLSLMMPHH